MVFEQKLQHGVNMNDAKTTFAAYFKALRKEKRITLWAFCEKAGAARPFKARPMRGTSQVQAHLIQGVYKGYTGGIQGVYRG